MTVSPRVELTRPAGSTLCEKTSAFNRRIQCQSVTHRSSATGKVTVTAKPLGKAGTKRAKRTLSLSTGRFVGKLKLKAGSYKVSVAYPGQQSVRGGDREQNHQGAVALRLRVGNRVGRNAWV